MQPFGAGLLQLGEWGDECNAITSTQVQVGYFSPFWGPCLPAVIIVYFEGKGILNSGEKKTEKCLGVPVSSCS